MLAEDIAAYFDTGMATAATLGGAAVSVILDTPAATLLGGEVIAAEPQAVLPTASVPPSPAGQLLHVPAGTGAGTYRVREHLPDGTGISTLTLTRVGPAA